MSFPWARHYDPGVPLEAEFPQATIPDLLFEATARNPRAPALVFFGKTTTYGQLLDQIQRLARAFRNLGLEPGERLAVLFPTAPNWWRPTTPSSPWGAWRYSSTLC